jgi:hypothetical protein
MAKPEVIIISAINGGSNVNLHEAGFISGHPYVSTTRGGSGPTNATAYNSAHS